MTYEADQLQREIDNLKREVDYLRDDLRKLEDDMYSRLRQKADIYHSHD